MIRELSHKKPAAATPAWVMFGRTNEIVTHYYIL